MKEFHHNSPFSPKYVGSTYLRRCF